MGVLRTCSDRAESRQGVPWARTGRVPCRAGLARRLLGHAGPAAWPCHEMWAPVATGLEQADFCCGVGLFAGFWPTTYFPISSPLFIPKISLNCFTNHYSYDPVR
jgi:hypothetical protein